MSEQGPLATSMRRLGDTCWRRPWSVILAWLLLTAAALVTAPHLPSRLMSGSGDIAESPSSRVDAALREDFPSVENQALLLVFRSPTLERDEAELGAFETALARRLVASEAVESVDTAAQLARQGLRPAAGRGRMLVVKLSTATGLASEQEVPRVRAAAEPLFDRVRARHPDLDWAVTGRPALTHDINVFSSHDSARSEIRALPLTIIVLVLAFGSLVAACLPLLLAVATRTLALGLVFVAAGPLEVSNLVVGIVTMLAIALGIDYSLFLIHRYRSHRAEIDPEHAIGPAMSEAGPALLYSGLAVAIGMGGLLLTPLMQTRSIGLGGIGAVAVSLAAALTLLPAVLALTQRILDWPPTLRSMFDGSRSRERWQRLGGWVIAHPLVSSIGPLIVLAVLAAPMLETRFGFPEEEFLPAELEYVRGLKLLEGMELKGVAAPITILVSDELGRPLVTPERAPELISFVERIRGDPVARLVITPNILAAARTLPFPVAENSATISADLSRLIVRVIPHDSASLAELQALSRSADKWLRIPGVAVDAGGQASYYNDFDHAVRAVYPQLFGAVLGLSALALLLMFRAPLVAGKALLLNLLSVAAGYGVVVWVFQLGHGAALFGLTAGTESIPATVPLVIFAILFGVSMDYEIFLLTRVRALFLKTGDHPRSLIDGLADTGTVITSAALVMVGVFGAFAFAQMVVVQMIGLGLAVAVLVDATLIRSLLGPALMQLAGRWNWWPLSEPAPK